MPVKPADAASGASAPIGIAAMSFRVDDSAIRQERESCNDLAVEGYVDVAERAEICDHLVSGLDIKRFGTSAGRDDLSGFNGETKSGYFLDEPKQGVPWIAEDIRTDAVVNFPADRFDGCLMLREIDGTPVGFRSGAKNEFVSAGVVRDQLGFANGGEIFESGIRYLDRGVQRSDRAQHVLKRIFFTPRFERGGEAKGKLGFRNPHAVLAEDEISAVFERSLGEDAPGDRSGDANV